jgi:hypothetical protein
MSHLFRFRSSCYINLSRPLPHCYMDRSGDLIIRSQGAALRSSSLKVASAYACGQIKRGGILLIYYQDTPHVCGTYQFSETNMRRFTRDVPLFHSVLQEALPVFAGEYSHQGGVMGCVNQSLEIALSQHLQLSELCAQQQRASEYHREADDVPSVSRPSRPLSICLNFVLDGSDSRPHVSHFLRLLASGERSKTWKSTTPLSKPPRQILPSEWDNEVLYRVMIAPTLLE